MMIKNYLKNRRPHIRPNLENSSVLFLNATKVPTVVQQVFTQRWVVVLQQVTARFLSVAVQQL